MHLLSDKLVELIERHSSNIVERWMVILRADPAMAALPKAQLEHLEGKASDILRHIGQWVNYDSSREAIQRRYEPEGRDFFELGIPLWDAVRVMYTLRRALWAFVGTQTTSESAYELSQLLELSDRVILFFDRAEFYIMQGYLNQMRARSSELWNIDSAALDRVFIPSKR